MWLEQSVVASGIEHTMSHKDLETFPCYSPGVHPFFIVKPYTEFAVLDLLSSLPLEGPGACAVVD